MKTKSQKQIILEELEKGYALSKIQMLEKFGIWNSGARLSELRQLGHRIETKMITHKVTDKTFAVYYLAKFENKLWPNKRLQA